MHPMDLSDHEAVQQGIAELLEAHGPPDVVVNNAGAGRWRSVQETEPAEAVSMMGAPYFAAFFVTTSLLPAMRERGSGWFLQVNSPACLMTFPGATGYSASRAALRAFSQGLAAELKGTGLGSTHLIAGEVSSEYFQTNEGSHDRLPGLARIYRVSPPEEVAEWICDAVQGERRTVVKPFLLWLTYIWFDMTPWTTRALVGLTAWRE